MGPLNKLVKHKLRLTELQVSKALFSVGKSNLKTKNTGIKRYFQNPFIFIP